MPTPHRKPRDETLRFTGKQAKVLDYLREHPHASMGEIAEHFGWASRNTAKHHVHRLRDMGLVYVHGTNTNTSYTAVE